MIAGILCSSGVVAVLWGGSLLVGGVVGVLWVRVDMAGCGRAAAGSGGRFLGSVVVVVGVGRWVVGGSVLWQMYQCVVVVVVQVRSS